MSLPPAQRRLRVLHFVWGFDSGGTENQLLQLVRLQRAAAACDVQVATLRREGVLLERFEQALGAPVQEFRTRSFYGPSMAAQLGRYVRHLRRQRIDVVHTHDFYANVFGLLGARLAAVPVRIASKRETLGLRTPAQDRMESLAYRLAQRIVANAATVGEHLAGRGVPRDKIVVIHNGLDPARAQVGPGWQRDEACRRFGLPPGLRYTTIVASLREVKDHATLLRAAARVASQVPDAGFALAGEGELREALRAQAQALGIAARVFFIGHCDAVADLLGLSAVGVLCSRAEGFSNAILEYMAAGLPVVATDVGGAREALREGESGHLVAPGDDAGLGARLIGLLREPERAQRMGAQGRARVEAEFSCAAQLARTQALYQALASGAPARAP